jgi:hypothetical protein
LKFNYYEKEYISKSKLLTGFRNYKGNILDELYPNIIYTNSGRVSLRIILDFLKSQNKIENKNSEVLIPKWICTGVVNSMHKVCFPSLNVSKETKGILVYHQYGFPQDMNSIMKIANDKNWFVIENCVNVVESYYKGKLLGTFGNASIFSLAKMFSVPQAGALYSKDFNLLKYAQEKINSGDNKLINNLWYLTRVFRSLDTKSNLFWPNLHFGIDVLHTYCLTNSIL